ncbi:ribonuclease domain-containing protein [Kribbella sp. NPDC058693]|uniref:ribonuclease domain-containing protein n=1 Tax=Kribbella sp. NPDC058693 TaxID=3346602 RepID=UPI0036644952
MRTLIAAVVLATTAAFGTTAYAAPTTAPTSSTYVVASAAAIDTCALSSLPSQAADTLDLIHSGGPFPYRQDGTVFQNREGILPDESSSYYHEYTVKTPGSSDRGARRLIGGGATTDPEHLYYTGDHYASFCEVDENS